MPFFRWILRIFSRFSSWLVRIFSLVPSSFYADLFSITKKELTFLLDEDEITKFELYLSFLSRLAVQSPLRRYLFLTFYGSRLTSEQYLAVASILKLDFLVSRKLSREELHKLLFDNNLKFDFDGDEI